MTILLLAGCTLPPYLPAERLVEPGPQTFYLPQIRDPYPDSCRLTQRIVLHRGRKTLDMTGYLFMKEDGSWQAVVLGDMGMELFQFQYSENQGEIITSPESFPRRPLYEGVIGDIQHLFGRRKGADRHLVRRHASTVSVVIRHGDGGIDEYEFLEGGNLPVRSLGVSNGRIIREAVYYETTAYPGCGRRLPRRIVLYNHRWRYSLEIVLLDVL